MIVRDIMTPDPITVRPSTPLHDAAQLMKEHAIRRLPVVERGRLQGIVTDRDLKEANASSATSLSVWELAYLLSKTPVKDVMKSPVITMGPDDPVTHAALVMKHHKIGGFPVVEGPEKRLIGIVTESDIFQAFCRVFGAERGYLRVTVADSPRHREQVMALLGLPETRTIYASPHRPQLEMVFEISHRPEAARMLLERLRQMPSLEIQDWSLSEDPDQLVTSLLTHVAVS